MEYIISFAQPNYKNEHFQEASSPLSVYLIIWTRGDTYNKLNYGGHYFGESISFV